MRARTTALELVGLVAMAIVPLALWYRVLVDILASFHWSFAYIVEEFSPWLLVLAGITFLLPVAASAGLHPENRLYPQARKAYASWGVALYLLGLMLLVQVAQLWHYSH